jgi:hypothetical protein
MEEKFYLPTAILHDFTARMEKLGIAYMLTGSVAMMKYSVYRYTADIDMILELVSTDAKRIIQTLEPDYYVPHNAVSRAIAAKKMFNVIHHETAFKVDCVVRKSSDFQKQAFARREKSDFYGREIWIITKEDLIISKLWWAKDSLSEKQLTDVKNLMRAGFDVEYVEKWTSNLNVKRLFEQCRKEIYE